MKSVSFKDYILSYYTFGDEGDVVLCFHGHGRTGRDFEFLKHHKVKVIAVNLFFHEESFLPNADPLNWKIVNLLLKKILHQEKVSYTHIFAYSQGGRFALKFYEYNSALTLSLNLLAPDGLDDRSLYSWSSRRLFFQTLFKLMSNNPKSIQKLTTVVSKTGLMRPKVRDFVYKFTEDKEMMQRAAKAWSSFSSIRPNAKKIGKLIYENKTPFKLIMGKQDQIIRPVQGEYFLKQAKISSEIKLLNSGHNFFKPEIFPLLVEELIFLNVEK